MPEAPSIGLANGVEMPVLGLGTWPMDDRQAERTVAAAIEAGYRLFDTAEAYGNERGVGRGIRASGIDREQLFVTTKFNRRWHGEREVREALANSAERLGLDRIDLLLIHWPNPQQDRYVDAWRGMLQLLEEGRLRAAGVSNFKPAHLDRLIAETGVAPHVNQIELNPFAPRIEERRYHTDHGIVTESWSPIGQAGALLRDPTIRELAEANGRTPAQVVLRWHVQLGLVAIPKTSHLERLEENLEVFDFVLTDEQMERLADLDGRDRVTDSDRYGH